MSLSFRRMLRTALALTALSTMVVRAGEPSPQFSPEQIDFFEKHVRPIFAEHCLKCHSPEKHKGGLTLDSRDNVLKGGDTGPAIVLGKPAESELVRAVTYDPDGYQMPPDGKLPDELIATLTKWVESGAPWPETKSTAAAATTEFNFQERAARWSFQPLEHVTPPVAHDAQWPRTPIDRFLLARLEAAGLRPAAETDRRTWVRRVYLDTIGLPPSSSEVVEFVADKSPDAYARVVERLLASPHFGERWGRHWLDLVRYAETRGHEFDFDVPNAWHYRDYVIRALNDDVPYDRFVVEHVAGDLLEGRESRGQDPGTLAEDGSQRSEVRSPRSEIRGQVADVGAAADLRPPTSDLATPRPSTGGRYSLRLDPLTGANESILGTGFWFFGEAIHSPVDIRQEEGDRFENMIDVYSKTFLGLTVACARCHDHKFDPIRQKDFYALQGYLQSSSYRQAMFETMEQNQAVADELGRLRKDAEPVLARTFAEVVQPTLDKLEAYLLAGRDVIQLGPEFQPEPSEVVFEDFEDGSYEGWTVTGDAFGDGPQTQQTIGSYQGNVRAVGKYFVNSHQIRGGGRGDNHVGTLTSQPFTIEHDYIRFLVDGGAHEGRTCVNLIVDGKVVLSATGRNSNEMSPVTWNVRPYKTRSAQIEVVDNERRGWGNIGVDQFVFCDRIAESDGQDDAARFSTAFLAKIDILARERDLQPDLLAEWTAHLLRAADDPTDPFRLWALVAAGKETRLEELIKKAEATDRPTATHDRDPDDQQIDQREGRWMNAARSFMSDGPAFRGLKPIATHLMNWSDDASEPISGFSIEGAVQWDPDFANLATMAGNEPDPAKISGWQRGGRLLRTPTFEIDRDRVYCLIHGGVNTYLAVDSHILINGPLHGSLLSEHPQQDGWRWIVLDASRYQGHRAHVEFIPRPGEPFEVAAIWLRDHDRTPAPYPTPGETLARTIAVKVDVFGSVPDFKVDDIARLTAENAGSLAQCVETAFNPRYSGGCSGLGPAEWALDHPRLFGLDSDAAKVKFAAVSSPYLQRRQALRKQIHPVSGTAPCMLDGSGEDEYVFIRGAWKKRGDTVPRRFLEVFHGHGPSTLNSRPSTPVGSGRLDLALQMVDPEQTPIVPRVIVNRIWQHYFGRGIVPTPDDFGHMGQEPSHPELLDWLANQLVEHDWSLKHIHRLILLSAAYRMESRAESGEQRAEREDPNNLLLHRMNIKRLEGEIIRDQILAESGRFDDRIYGPSVPVHLTPFMDGRGRPGLSGAVDGDGRRSLYIAVRRNFPDPFFQAFDFPNPHSAVGRRSVSNVPAQALALMNNPFVVQQARVWAERLLSDAPEATPEQRIDRLYVAAFDRAPTADELAAGVEFVHQQAAEYNGGEDDPRVWADYCHVLMNVKEFVFIQ